MEPAVAEVWQPTRELAHSRLREAFAALDRPSPSTVALDVEPALRARIVRATRKNRRRRAALNLLSKTYDSPLGVPLRALLPRILPLR